MPQKDLFRQQVLEARRLATSQFGRPAATVPPAWSWFILGLCIFFAALMLFATLVDFSRKEKVRGLLRYSQAEARVIALEGGTITQMFVTNGSKVSIGDPLIELESDRFLRDGRRLSDLAIDQIDVEIRAVEERFEASVNQISISRRGLSQRQTSLQRRLETSRSRLETVTQRIDVARSRLEQAQNYLAEGLVAQVAVDAREAEYNSIESELNSLRREISLDEAELATIGVDIEQNDTQLAQTQADTAQEISRLNGRKQDASSSAGQQLIASVDGVVTGLQVREGEPMSPGRLMLAIVPEDSALYAELFLPSSAIAFVKKGQDVKLQYDALPYQKFGVGEGVITSVSSTAFLASDLGMATQNDELLYRVEVTLNRQSVDAFGKPIPLQSGMELSADIVLEERRVLDWALTAFQQG